MNPELMLRMPHRGYFLSGNFRQAEIRPWGEQLKQRRMVRPEHMWMDQRSDFPFAAPDDTSLEQPWKVIPAKLAAVDLDGIKPIRDGHEQQPSWRDRPCHLLHA